MSDRKVAVVTGASSGMGLATAREMARRGHDLVLSSRRPEVAADEIRSAFGVRVEAVAGSIAEPDLAARLAAAAQEMGGARALLLNHGGPPVKPMMALTDEDWSGAFETMVVGPLRVMRALVPQMQAAAGGRVLAISSFTVKAPWAGIGLSNALRAALVNALKTAALELGPEGGILVNALAPGYVETDRIRDWNDSYARQENVGVEEIRARTLATIPLRRYGTPEGYARLAAFLLSEENDYVSGQQILYDGGLVVAN
ncbi:SDR family oxidoreductase [uncultured Bradyrhizobium sp.]|uniref:SDR family oxidoreductase n=1 Tax=Bradyrhizobium sp. TaxID=376 RepID=UPI002630FA4C|nr:SDR family oxidoreductase [uncultured Bradyrhizobium sp.]